MGYKNGQLQMKIAVCGKLRTGKNALADMISKEYVVTQFAFSEGIWKVGKLLFPFQFNRKEKPRYLLQTLGQKLREVDSNIWIRYIFNTIDASGVNKVIITDLRQPNEYKALKDDGYFIIKIEADDEKRLERARSAGDNFTLADMQHETESHIDSFEADYTVNNNGSLPELEQQMNEAMDQAVFLAKGLQYTEKGAKNAGGKS